MHPIIAALAFIFSPSDDWLLKRAYELALQAEQVPGVVQDYNQMDRQFPSINKGENGVIQSADLPSMVAWTEILQKNDYFEEAQNLRHALLTDPNISPALSDDLHLRLGETALLNGNISEAEKEFTTVVLREGGRAVDAQTDLLIVALAKGDAAETHRISEDLKSALGPLTETSRAIFPMALAEYAQNNLEKANELFAMLGNDPRANYFSGLAYRKMNQPVEALARWQSIRKDHPNTQWDELAQFQVAETYFQQGDDTLSRVACEKALAANPKLSKEFVFRLASLDMRHGDYEKALNRLAAIPMEGDLAQRASVVMAESMVKLGRAGEMFKTVSRKLPRNATPLSTYQAAWANSFDLDYDRSFMIAERGLEDFYDPEVTPRLLLLEAIAYENLDMKAEALATYQTIVDRFPTTVAAAQSVDWLARSYLRLGRTREAVTHVGALWASLPKDIKKEHPDAAFWLAEAHTKLNRFEDASVHYNEYLALAKPNSPLYPYAQFQEAMTLAQLNQTPAALAQLGEFSRTAEQTGKTQWVEMARVQRGNFLFNSKQFQDAVLAYRAATDTPKAQYYEALALYHLDYFTDAVDTWKKLALAHPEDPYAEQALFRSGRTLFETGKSTDAVEVFASYIEKYPESPRVKEAILQSAHALYNAGRFAEAMPMYSNYLARYRTTDDLVAVTPYLAACVVQTGKTLDEAEALLKNLPPADALASMRWETGAKGYNDKKYEEANAVFARLLTDFPSNSNAREAEFFRGESLFLANHWADANGAYTGFLAMDGTDKSAHAPLALFHKGISLYQQDKMLLAAKTFENFVQNYPSDALASDAKNNLVLCYHNIGDFETRDQMKQKYGVTDPAVAAPHQAEPKSDMAQQNQPASDEHTKKKPYLVEKDKLHIVKQENKENVADSRGETPPADQANQ